MNLPSSRQAVRDRRPPSRGSHGRFTFGRSPQRIRRFRQPSGSSATRMQSTWTRRRHTVESDVLLDQP